MEFFELFSWILRGDGMIRFLGNMTLSDFISTIAFLVVCWYFLNNQIKKGFQIQGQEIKENGQEIKNILPLVKKEIEIGRAHV